MVARRPPALWILGGKDSFGRLNKPDQVRVLRAEDPEDETLRAAAYIQHLLASEIQRRARQRSGTKTRAGARKWLVMHVKTMNRDTLRAVLSGETTMTVPQLYDLESVVGPVYAGLNIGGGASSQQGIRNSA